VAPRRTATAVRVSARQRILDSAYELFSRHGIRSVGIERIIAESGVAKKTLYHHFASKTDLVVAFLEVREERWTRAWLEREIGELATTPAERPLTLFDVLDDWFRSADFESCAFIRTLLETPGPDDVLHRRSVHHLEVIRAMLEEHAAQAGAPDPERAAYQLQTLMMGAIVSATRGDVDAARRVRTLAAVIVGGAR
jgi:AcrR family transcriptional regulator